MLLLRSSVILTASLVLTRFVFADIGPRPDNEIVIPVKIFENPQMFETELNLGLVAKLVIPKQYLPKPPVTQDNSTVIAGMALSVAVASIFLLMRKNRATCHGAACLIGGAVLGGTCCFLFADLTNLNATERPARTGTIEIVAVDGGSEAILYLKRKPDPEHSGR